MTDQPFHNESSQAERRAMLKQDRASTFFARAMASMGEELGRYSHLGKEQVVTGSKPVPQFPRIPSGPWSEPCPSGTSPPLGYSVDAMEPVEAPSVLAISEGPSGERRKGPVDDNAVASPDVISTGPVSLRGKV
jgi:hypothetical protein